MWLQKVIPDDTSNRKQQYKGAPPALQTISCSAYKCLLNMHINGKTYILRYSVVEAFIVLVSQMWNIWYFWQHHLPFVLYTVIINENSFIYT